MARTKVHWIASLQFGPHCGAQFHIDDPIGQLYIPHGAQLSIFLAMNNEEKVSFSEGKPLAIYARQRLEDGSDVAEGKLQYGFTGYTEPGTQRDERDEGR